MLDALEAHTYIRSTYDHVWRHVTTAAGFAQWFSAPGIEFGAAVGAGVRWGAAGEPVIDGELTAIERGVGFSHTFEFEFLPEREASCVRWDVVEQGQVVWVHVVHDVSAAPQTAATIGATGWPKALARLKTLLETGSPMPWPDEGSA